MTDWQGDITYPKRVPRDQFEAEIYRRIIQAEISTWRNLDSNISEDHKDGVWTLYVSPESEPSEVFDFAAFYRAPMVSGGVWLAEREYPASEHYRVMVMWALGSQTNADAPPVLFWDRPHPAGPWS